MKTDEPFDYHKIIQEISALFEGKFDEYLQSFNHQIQRVEQRIQTVETNTNQLRTNTENEFIRLNHTFTDTLQSIATEVKNYASAQREQTVQKVQLMLDRKDTNRFERFLEFFQQFSADIIKQLNSNALTINQQLLASLTQIACQSTPTHIESSSVNPEAVDPEAVDSFAEMLKHNLGPIVAPRQKLEEQQPAQTKVADEPEEKQPIETKEDAVNALIENLSEEACVSLSYRLSNAIENDAVDTFWENLPEHERVVIFNLLQKDPMLSVLNLDVTDDVRLVKWLNSLWFYILTRQRENPLGDPFQESVLEHNDDSDTWNMFMSNRPKTEDIPVHERREVDILNVGVEKMYNNSPWIIQTRAIFYKMIFAIKQHLSSEDFYHELSHEEVETLILMREQDRKMSRFPFTEFEHNIEKTWVKNLYRIIDEEIKAADQPKPDSVRREERITASLIGKIIDSIQQKHTPDIFWDRLSEAEIEMFYQTRNIYQDIPSFLGAFGDFIEVQDWMENLFTYVDQLLNETSPPTTKDKKETSNQTSPQDREEQVKDLCEEQPDVVPDIIASLQMLDKTIQAVENNQDPVEFWDSLSEQEAGIFQEKMFNPSLRTGAFFGPLFDKPECKDWLHQLLRHIRRDNANTIYIGLSNDQPNQIEEIQVIQGDEQNEEY